MRMMRGVRVGGVRALGLLRRVRELRLGPTEIPWFGRRHLLRRLLLLRLRLLRVRRVSVHRRVLQMRASRSTAVVTRGFRLLREIVRQVMGVVLSVRTLSRGTALVR